MMITVDYCRLPGPDTRTKREAATTGDNRLLQMLRIASDIGWPLAWTDDLYRHDREKLAAHPGEPFLWILRDTGTHAYPLRCGNRHEARGYCQTIHYWSGEHQLNVTDDADQRARYYVVSSSGVKSLSWQEATKCFSYPER